jgi:hypothetical protein
VWAIIIGDVPIPDRAAAVAHGAPVEPDGTGDTGGHDPADGDLRLITTLTSFATATDVTLAELHLEAFLPADDRTGEVLRRRWG